MMHVAWHIHYFILLLLIFLAVFTFKLNSFNVCDSYRIRLPTEKELEMKVSKDVKKMRFYESTLLSSYKVSIPFFKCLLCTKCSLNASFWSMVEQYSEEEHLN